MQRTANLITALTALALAVAFVAGLSFQTQRTDAAAATIAALNVGTCHTTDSSVLDEDDCNPHYRTFEFNQQGLEDAVEVEMLWATYAHDPKTSDRPPRGILKDSDLLKISIKDDERDVRTGVLVISSNTAELTAHTPDGTRLKLTTPFRATTPVNTGTPSPTPDAGRAQDHFGAVVADAIDRHTYGEVNDEIVHNVPPIETGFTFKRTDVDSGTNAVEIDESGIVELVFEEVSGVFNVDGDQGGFKPIARGRERGEMRFFGDVDNTVNNSLDRTMVALDDYLEWDEDVVSGSNQNAPAISLQANLGRSETITLRSIYYLTSRIEYMIGGERCRPPEGIPDNEETDVDESEEKGRQAACTDEELGDNVENYDDFMLEVMTDVGAITRNIYLRETDRFSGVFQGFVRLTDSDGDGGEFNTAGVRLTNAERINWGREIVDAKGHDLQDAAEVMSDDAAVIGVRNGPVSIAYRDTDGVTRRFEIEIDVQPPVIDVSTPSHDGRSDDQEINFLGSINDGESGLAEDSFALYIDHANDPTDATAGSLRLPVDSTVLPNDVDPDDDLGDVIVDPDANSEVVATATQYGGFDNTNESGSTKQTFGVINAILIYPASGSDGYDVGEDNAGNDRKGFDAQSFNDGDKTATFRDQIRVNFLEASERRNDVYNHAIDFHAVVRDAAGNVGFSDSDEANPRFINDLGTEMNERTVPNVLGVFSRHVVYIDNVDPFVVEDKTVTGFYDVDGDKEPVVDPAGVMVVFDGPIDERSVDAQTFELTMGTGDDAVALSIVDVEVEGKLVFLKLDRELESDATPVLTIAEGQEVRDLAGRVTRSGEDLIEDENRVGVDDDVELEVTVNDGNLPKFTVELSEGSGTGTGAEGESMLTRDTIKVSITSDERIQGPPRVAVVCESWEYREGEELRNVSNFIESRRGARVTAPDGSLPEGECGAIVERQFRSSTTLSRGTNQWEYVWRQLPDKGRVPDGMATVVIWGNDRSTYERHDSELTVRNWGSASGEFRFDSTFRSPLNETDGVLPAPGQDVTERRPFVLLNFQSETTTVKVTEMTVDGVDVTASLDEPDRNRFLYWPETLGSDEVEVKFSARDAADNPLDDESFKFKITKRKEFVLSLFAGWNAISFPADPKENSLENVFGADTTVERVIGWIPDSPTGPWAIATKADGVWMSSIETANLNELRAQYGYWVYSTDFGDVGVELLGPIDRETGDVPLVTGIPTYPGWNFVGVVDQDGDQTEGRAGANLKDGITNVAGEENVGQQDDIEVKDYLAGFARAYRWDVITNSYQELTGSDNVRIGEGIWVYFGEAGIAP